MSECGMMTEAARADAEIRRKSLLVVIVVRVLVSCVVCNMVLALLLAAGRPAKRDRQCLQGGFAFPNIRNISEITIFTRTRLPAGLYKP